MGKVCVMVACPTRSTFHILYHKFAVSRRYSQDATDIQYNYIHCCTCIIMRIPPSTLILCNYWAVWKFQWHKCLSPDPFPIFEGGVRQRHTLHVFCTHAHKRAFGECMLPSNCQSVSFTNVSSCATLGSITGGGGGRGGIISELFITMTPVWQALAYCWLYKHRH